MALQAREQQDILAPPDDGKDALRADILGSIIKSDPNSPGYLGRIDSLVTAHGALGSSSPTMGSSGGVVNSLSDKPVASEPSPMMGEKKPAGFLGKIGHVASRMGNIAGDVLAPGVMMNIPGTDLNKQLQDNRTFRRGAEERKLATEEAGAAARTSEAASAASRAKTDEEKERFAESQAGQPKPKEESWELSKDYAGPNGEPVEIEKNSGTLRIAGSGISGIQRVEKPEKRSFEEQGFDEYKKTHPNATQLDYEKERAAATQKPERPERPQQQLAMTPDGKVIELRPGMSVPPGTKSLGGELNATVKQEQGEEAGASAVAYANDYLAGKQWTGPGDEALMEKFFEMAKPSSGFRMTLAQTEMLMKSRDAMNSVIAKGKHLLTPEAPWFSDTQRKQIVKTMNDLAKSRAEVKPGAGGGGGGAHNFTFNGKQYSGVPDELYNKYKGKPGFKE